MIIFILFFIKRYQNESKELQDLKPKPNLIEDAKSELGLLPQSKSHPLIPYRKIKLVLGGLCLSMYFAAEVGYFSYCTSMWQYMDIKLSSVEANRVMTVMTAVYTLGPLLTAFISMKIKIDNILSYHYVLLVCGMSVLLYFGRLNKTLIYIGSVILGNFIEKNYIQI